MFEIRENNIYTTRGDTGMLRVVQRCKGEIIPFGTKDRIYLTVKKNTYTENKVLQKIVDNFLEDGTGLIRFDSNDTDICYGSYVYDVQISKQDGINQTGGPYKFVVAEEVTFEKPGATNNGKL